MIVTKVLVKRQPSAPDWTLSDFLFDAVKMGVGVEDEYRKEKVHGETRIPEGIYQMGLRDSPRFSKEYYRDDQGNLLSAKSRTTAEQKARYHTAHEMIWVKDVPGFEFILWHWGNTDNDTHGCYIVGSAFGDIAGQKGVVSSRVKYVEIYPILWRSIKAGSVTVEYKS